MFTIKIADLVIQINNQYSEIEALCNDYITTDRTADIIVSLTDQDIEKERISADGDFSNGYLEGIGIYRELCNKILPFDAFLLHASVVSVDGGAYAFTAKSGVGKTTHTRLWLDYFKERAVVVNGDKPILRFSAADELMVYGTPWCGKEGMQSNIAAPLKALCFLERSEINQIRRATEEEVIDRLFHQVLRPKKASEMDALLAMLNRLLQFIPCYILKCNISEASVITAYEGMNR